MNDQKAYTKRLKKYAFVNELFFLLKMIKNKLVKTLPF